MRSKKNLEQRQDLLVDVMYDVDRIRVIQEALEESSSGLGDLRRILLDGSSMERVVSHPPVLAPDW